MGRIDGRAYDELRPLTITPDFNKYAEGSVLIRQGCHHVFIHNIEHLSDIHRLFLFHGSEANTY